MIMLFLRWAITWKTERTLMDHQCKTLSKFLWYFTSGSSRRRLSRFIFIFPLMRAARIRRKGISRRSEFSAAECDRVPVVFARQRHLVPLSYRTVTTQLVERVIARAVASTISILLVSRGWRALYDDLCLQYYEQRASVLWSFLITKNTLFVEHVGDKDTSRAFRVRSSWGLEEGASLQVVVHDRIIKSITMAWHRSPILCTRSCFIYPQPWAIGRAFIHYMLLNGLRWCRGT